MGRRKKLIRRRFKLNIRTKRNLKKQVKIIIVGIFIGIGMYTLLEMDKYEYKTLTREELEIEEENFKFIKSIEVEAQKSYKEYKIFPSITIAQAILESGWGNSQLTKDSNNLFGIKADDSWKGKTIEIMTTENYNDKIDASFRKYNSIEASIKDHAEFLKENKRYEKNGVFKAENYKEQAQALEDAGYSTKQNSNGEYIYGDMLIELIETYKLYLLD